MARLSPVDFDPFAPPVQAAPGPRLTPVDFDPFAGEATPAKSQLMRMLAQDEDALGLQANLEDPRGLAKGIANLPEADKRAMARGALEGGGMMLGGLVGSAGGPAGTALGGGLGYAMGKNLAGKLDEEQPSVGQQFAAIPVDVATGAAMDMGGQLVGAGLQAVGQGARNLAKRLGPSRWVADDLAAAKTLEPEVVEQNMAAAKALEEEVPGLKFDVGQASNDPGMIGLTRKEQVKPKSYGPMALQRSDANQALRGKLKDEFGLTMTPEDASGIPLAQKQVQEQMAAREASRAAQEAELAAPVQSRLQAAPEGADTGEAAYSALSTARTARRGEVGRLYDQFEAADPSIPATPLAQVVQGIRAEAMESGAVDVPPIVARAARIIQGATKAVETDIGGTAIMRQVPNPEAGAATFKQLRQLRSDLNDEIRAARSGVSPDAGKVRWLEQTRQGVQDTLDQLADDTLYPELAAKYRSASQAYRQYAQDFKQAGVGDVLRPGPRGEASRIPPTESMGRLFTDKGGREAAKQFKSALGDEQAEALARDHALASLRDYATDAQGKIAGDRLVKWREKYKDALAEFPALRDELAGVTKAQRTLEAFQASGPRSADEVADKALELFVGADPSKAVEKIMSGADHFQKTAAIWKDVKASPEAADGFRRAMSAEIRKRAELNVQDATGEQFLSSNALRKLLGEYERDMRMVYTPQQFKAWKTVQEGYATLERTNRSAFAGSDSVTKLPTKFAMSLAGGKLNLLYRGLEALTAPQRDAILREAVLNPQVAYDLIRLRGASAERVESGLAKAVEAVTKLGAVGDVPGLVGNEINRLLEGK